MQGGIVAPMIITGPGVGSSGVIEGNYATVTAIAPTLLEVAGARYPDDGSVRPMLGESMVDFLAGNQDHIHDDDYVTVFSHRGRAYVRKGKWKIVTMNGPFDEADFQLFDIASDPGETNNLYFEHPEIVHELKSQLEKYKQSGRSAPLRSTTQ